MYISSDGTLKDVTTMNSEYIINALSKSMRDIFNSQSIEEYNIKLNNIQLLYNEIYGRIGEFLTEKIDEEWK